MTNLLLYLIINNIFLRSISANNAADYWSDDYDLEKNCESEDIIKTLNTKTECVTNSIPDPKEAIKNCKYDLFKKASTKCEDTRLKSGGTLLYCRDRGLTTCCFHELKCEKDWVAIAADMFPKAYSYLTNKDDFFKNKTKEGYKTCHPLEGYDVSKCEEDCKSFEDSQLAKECREKNGLLKCCIRRDKAFCDECRYCCTFPFCSYKNGTNSEVLHHFESSTKEAALANQDNTATAFEQLSARNFMFKGEDTRCLKPGSDPDPGKWHHYDPDDFVSAVTKEELDLVNTTEFDIGYMNFEDMDVFAAAVGNIKESRAFFKKSYGFDFISFTPKKLSHLPGMRAQLPCVKDCMEKEQSPFAKRCRKKKGVFKCCILGLDLNPFAAVRESLKEKNLISSYDNPCKKGKSCVICGASYLCTTKNVYTQEIEQEYMTVPNLVGGKNIILNGEHKRLPLKNSLCLPLNGCLGDRDMSLKMEDFYPAATKEEFCKIRTNIFPSSSDKLLKKNEVDHPEEKWETETNTFFELASMFMEKDEATDKTDTLEKCKKRKSIVKICREKDMETLHATEETILINSLLRKMKNKLKKKQKKRKKKKKRKGDKKKRKSASKRKKSSSKKKT